MTNHPNRTATRAAIAIHRDSDGQPFQNLAGVFDRVFRIACGNVRATGAPQTVTYFNDRYTITRAE